jgi:DNA-directed RNA polymerase specialized sigma24 family protein
MRADWQAFATKTGAGRCQRADNDHFVTAAVALLAAAREKVVEDAYREVLSEFLARDHDGLRDAPTVLAPVVGSLVNRLAGDLVEAGMADEVVSQTFMLLLSPTARQFDPAHGSSVDYLYGVVLRAVAEVRVQHGATGVAKHERRLRLVRDKQDDEQACRHLRAPSYEDSADAICVKVDVDKALKAAPRKLQVAAALLGARDLSMTEAAALVGLDRNTLRRRLRAWATTAGLTA